MNTSLKIRYNLLKVSNVMHENTVLATIAGVEGLESAIEADTDLEATEPSHLFDFYVNTCPLQQTRTVRTEEAVLISLCQLQDKMIRVQ